MSFQLPYVTLAGTLREFWEERYWKKGYRQKGTVDCRRLKEQWKLAGSRESALAVARISRQY